MRIAFNGTAWLGIPARRTFRDPQQRPSRHECDGYSFVDAHITDPLIVVDHVYSTE